MIELAKGKTGIEVEALSALPKAIELLMKATQDGELDESLQVLIGNFGRQIKSG